MVGKLKYLPKIFSVFLSVAPLRSRFSDPNGLEDKETISGGMQD